MKVGGNPAQQSRFARAGGARDDGEFVVGAPGGADSFGELLGGKVSHQGSSRFGCLNLLLTSGPLLDPGVNLGREEFPPATDVVSGHLLALDPFVDRVAIDAQMGGDFLDGQPALLHNGFSGFSASDSFPVRRGFGWHCRNAVR